MITCEKGFLDKIENNVLKTWRIIISKWARWVHSMILFIIWLSLRLLLLVPNCETIFFLCSKLHFCTLDSFSSSFTAVHLRSYIPAFLHYTTLPPSTTATRYYPGSFTPRCLLMSNSSPVDYTFPSWTPRIWLNCKIFISWDIVVW